MTRPPILARLDGVSELRLGVWRARCPVDRRTLTIRIDEQGTALVCAGGCTEAAITAAVGMKPADLAPPGVDDDGAEPCFLCNRPGTHDGYCAAHRKAGSRAKLKPEPCRRCKRPGVEDPHGTYRGYCGRHVRGASTERARGKAVGNWARIYALRVPGLARNEKLTLAALAGRANGAGECWPSVRRLAADTGFGPRWVRASIRKLEVRGLVTSILCGYQRSTLYRVHGDVVRDRALAVEGRR